MTVFNKQLQFQIKSCIFSSETRKNMIIDNKNHLVQFKYCIKSKTEMIQHTKQREPYRNSMVCDRSARRSSHVIYTYT